MADPVTLKCPNHHQMLISGLWNSFRSHRGVDFDVRWGDRTIQAHQLILELFLMPEMFASGADETVAEEQQPQQPKDSLDYFLEFMYKGEVTVGRGELDDLLQIACEAGFQMLVKAIESTTEESRERGEVDGTADPTALLPFVRTSGDQSAVESISFEEQVEVEEKPNENALLRTIRPCSILLKKVKAANKQNKMHIASKRKAKLPCSVSPYFSYQNSQEPTFGSNRVDASQCKIDGVSSDAESPYALEDGEIRSRLEALVKAADDQNEVDVCKASVASLAQCDLGVVSRFECSHCAKAFPKHALLKRHFRATHSAEKTFQCNRCPKAFSRHGNLVKHVRIHTGEKPASLYKCDLCSETFSRKANFQRHSIVHSEDRPYKCDVCLVGFKVHKMLRTHMRIHNEEETFKCDVCNATYVHQRSLRVHLLMHTEEKPASKF